MSFRDRPNLLYFDILKCAVSVNVMASVLNGFQCPTTQVHTAAAVFCSCSNSLISSLCCLNIPIFSSPIGVCERMSL